MTPQQPLLKLIDDITGDFKNILLVWQLGAIVASIVLGWTLARMLRTRFGRNENQGNVARFGVESFGSVMGPLAIMCLLWISRLVLRQYMPHTNLINVAMPIFGALAAIRFTFYILRRVFARHREVSPGMVSFEKLFQLLVWAAYVLYITGMWDEVFYFLDHTFLPLGKYKVTIADILQAAISVVVLLMLALWAGTALEELSLIHI